jgi:hypothetical protein
MAWCLRKKRFWVLPGKFANVAGLLLKDAGSVVVGAMLFSRQNARSAKILISPNRLKLQRQVVDGLLKLSSKGRLVNHQRRLYFLYGVDRNFFTDSMNK